MDNILDNLSENKGKLFISVLIFIVFIVLVTFLGNVIEKNNDKKTLEKALVSLGERVYTDAYYEYLKKEPSEYEVSGIKITLDDMFDIIDLEVSDYFYNRKTKETCNINNSYVKIYPKSPYGVNDYEIDYNLDCGY